MRKSIVILLILISMVSCSLPPDRQIHPYTAVSVTATAIQTVVQATETKPSTIKALSQTPLVNTPTLSTTPVLFTPACLDIETTLSGKTLPAYSLVLSGDEPDAHFIYSFQKGERIAIPNGGSPYSTSYDGNWLAYVDEKFGVSSHLVLQTYDQNTETRIPNQNDWLFSFPWIDENRIYINVMDSPIPDVLVMDARTGEQTLLKTDYPDVMPFDWFGGSDFHFGLSTAIYDPSLEKVVYRKTLEQEDGFRHYITLYNRVTKEELASIEDEPYFRYPFRTPIWSIDGQEVIVACHVDDVSELYRIEHTGEVSQLTHFRDRYLDLKFGEMTLSPNSKYLAFWVFFSDDPIEGELFLLDMRTTELANLCFPATGKYGETPVWSPDSRYFAVAGSDQTILVDIQENWAAQISDDAYPIGWLKEP